MNVVDFNLRILIQKSDVISDEIGNRKNEWTDYYSCWAAVSEASGDENTETGVTVEHFPIVFTVRDCKKIKDMDTLKFRIVFKDDFFNIISIDHCGYKGETVKIRCERVTR